MSGEVGDLKVTLLGDASDLIRAIEQTESALNRLNKATTNAEKASQRTSNVIDKSAKRMADVGKAVSDVSKDVDTIAKPLCATSAALAAGGVAAVKFAMDYETAFTGVKKTVDGTDKELNKLNDDIRQMALEVPVSAAELANLAAIGGQLGVKVSDIEKFTRTIAAMGVATNLTGEEGASALARIINVTGESMNNIDRIGSSIVALGNNSATTEREIADMAVRMGKFGNTVGINAQQVLGYSAALSSLGVEAQAGGSAIGRVWLDIEKAVSSGGEALSVYAKYSGKTADEFKQQWSTDASGAFSGLIEGLSKTEDLTAALGELGINNTLDQQSVMALANNFGLLENSLKLSSQAYEENTALTKESDAAYATTANQIQLAKNNIVEAAMDFGQVLLPSVVNATDGIKGFASGIANMSDESKQNLVTVGKWVIGIGAATKGATSITKHMGDTVEAIGNVKKAFSAGGALAKFAPAAAKVGTALGSVASVAGPAAIGIAAVGATVWAGKKAYDAWYDSEYRWSKGLSDGNDAIREKMDSIKSLSGIQQELEDIKFVIESPESSQAQVDEAKGKLEEIAALLADEYNLVINTNTGDGGLDEAIEYVERLKNIDKNEMRVNMAQQQERLNALKPKFDSYKTDLAGLQAEAKAASEAALKYSDLKTKMSELRTVYQDTGDEKEYMQGLKEIGEALNIDAEKLSKYSTVEDMLEGLAMPLNNLAKEGAKFKDINNKITDLTNSYNEYRSISKEMANWNTELIGLAAMEGDAEGVNQALQRMGPLIKGANLDMHGYAVAAAEAMNGQGSLNKAMSEGGDALNTIISDYERSAKAFGASETEILAGTTLLKNGFTSIGEAAQAGKLDTVITNFVNDANRLKMPAQEIATTAALFKSGFSSIGEAAQAGKLGEVEQEATRLLKTMKGFENSKIKITAEGDIKIIDEVADKLKEVRGEEVTVSINAEGNIDIISQLGIELGELDGEAASVEVNADGNIDVLNEAGEKIAEVDGKTGTVTVTAEGDTEELDDAEGKVNEVDGQTATATLDAEDNVTEKAESAKTAIEDVPETHKTTISETGSSTVIARAKSVASAIEKIPTRKTFTMYFETVGEVPKQEAKGTSDFKGGLAMINDERGVSDPRELVEIGDKGYIFEGKDVVLPLPKHSRVYTASQTKKIMAGNGIPHYARGKNNEAWETAQDDWRHYTTINNVSASEALRHWDEMLKRFKGDAEVVKEIQEEIVKSTKDLWNEDLDAIEYALDMKWISEEEYYERLWKYREENFAEGTEEYKNATLKLREWELSKPIDDADFAHDMGWMSDDEYYQKLWEHRDANYKVGTEEWREATLQLRKWEREQLEAANNSSKIWVESTNFLNTWEEQGDSMLGAYVRYRDRNLAAVKEGIASEQDAYEDNNDFLETMLDGRVQNTLDAIDREGRVWGLSTTEQMEMLQELSRDVEAFYSQLGVLTDEQRVFKIKLEATIQDNLFDTIGEGISEWENSAALYLQESQTLGWDWKNKGDSEVSFYLRQQEEYQRLLEEGGLNAEQYADVQQKGREAWLNAYAAAASKFDEQLTEQQDKLNEMRTKFSDEISELRNSWTVDDRRADIRETKEQLAIFENAVTKEGREEYERLQEELERLEREEQIYKMEQENNRILAEFEEGYKRLEESKGVVINDILSEAQAFNGVYSTALQENTSNIDSAVAENLPAIKEILSNMGKDIIGAFENIGSVFNITNNIDGADAFDGMAFADRFTRGLMAMFGGR